MVEFTIKFAALNCQWGFKNTFVSLPIPGDKNFSALYESLMPYGITLSSVTLEGNPQNLAEKRLVISLLDGRLKLRLAHGGFEFLFTDMRDGDEFSLSDFTQAFVPLLKEMGGDAEQGIVQFTYRAFIHLGRADLDGFLRKHLIGYQDNTQLTPFNFTYQISLRTGGESLPVRLHIGRSIAANFPTELFAEIVSEYLAPGEVAKFSKQVADDWHQAFASLGLKLGTTRGEDNASK